MNLSRESLSAANRCFRLNAARLGDLLELCGRLENSEALKAKAVEYHGLFFHTDMDAYAAAHSLRAAAETLGADAGAFEALIVMSGLGHMRATYAARGIPENILTDSLKDLTIWMDDYEQRHGRTGLSETGWLIHTLRGELFRIGRFQFFNRVFEANIALAERRTDGTAVAFFAKPERLRSDGQADGTNGICDAETGWRSSFKTTAHEITGTPVHPAGYAMRKSIRLQRTEWELAVQPGCRMLDIHIPKDGKMDFNACRDSIVAALRFFKRYFPEQPIDVIHLCTWFLDPQLQTLLPPESNIVRFQREFYLLPVLSTDHSCLERVFGRADIDIREAPEDTSLRRAVKRFMLEGGHMREGRGIILPRHMPYFGQARYQADPSPFLFS